MLLWGVAVVVGLVEDGEPRDVDEAPPVGVDQVLLGEGPRRRARGDESPREQQHQVRACGLLQVVGAVHHGPAAVALLVDQLEDPLHRRQVQPGHGLVEQQQLRVGGEALRDEDPLALAAGEVLQLAVLLVEHAHPLERGVDRLPAAAAEPAHQPGAAVAPHRHDLTHGERGRTSVRCST